MTAARQTNTSEFSTPKRLTAKQRRQQRREGKQVEVQDYRFSLIPLNPLTDNQRVLWRTYPSADVMMLDGYPGTGKTFSSLYLALTEVMQSRGEEFGFRKVLVVRSSVQTRNQGHLPGDEKQKMAVFESLYGETCAKLFGRGDAYQMLKSQGMLEFTSTSFMRGVSLEDTIVIVDECQSMNYHELRTILTRVGRNCKILFCGDETQDDLRAGTNRNDKSGMGQMRAVLTAMGRPAISFGADDIVRSALVKSFILAEEDLKKRGEIVV